MLMMNKKLLDKYYIYDSIFIFSSVGSHLSNEYKNAVFKSWELDRFNSGCVSFNDSDDFPYSKYFKTIIHKSGFKFPNFFYFDDLFKITDNYEYICILDDDLLFEEPNSIIETISKMKDFNISVCSLSNNNKGKTVSYGIMCADNTRTIKITNFCEMGCMILHNNFLKLVKQEYFKNYPLLTDFGFDWFICSLANNTNHIIGIIQYLFFFNPVHVDRNIGYNDWINYKNSIRYIHPVVHRTIDVTS